MASTTLVGPETFRIGRVLSESFAVLGRNVGVCFWLGLILGGLPRAIFGTLLWPIVSRYGIHEFPALRVTYALVQVISYKCADGMLQVAFAWLAMEDLRGNRPTLRHCLGVTGGTLLSATAIWLLANQLFVFCGYVDQYAIGHYMQLLLKFPWPSVVWVPAGIVVTSIPALFFWVRWFVAIPTLVMERSSVLRCLARSRDLTKGSRWPLVAFWLGMFAVFFLMGLALRSKTWPFGVPARYVLDALQDTTNDVVRAVVMAVGYNELLRIKEGTGVDDLAEIFS